MPTFVYLNYKKCTYLTSSSQMWNFQYGTFYHNLKHHTFPIQFICLTYLNGTICVKYQVFKPMTATCQLVKMNVLSFIEPIIERVSTEPLSATVTLKHTVSFLWKQSCITFLSARPRQKGVVASATETYSEQVFAVVATLNFCRNTRHRYLPITGSRNVSVVWECTFFPLRVPTRDTEASVHWDRQCMYYCKAQPLQPSSSFNAVCIFCERPQRRFEHLSRHDELWLAVDDETAAELEGIEQETIQ